MLVQIAFEDGVLHENGLPFHVESPDDIYNALGFGQIILADRTKEGSVDKASLAVIQGFDADDNEIVEVIYKMPFDWIVQTVNQLITDYMDPRHPG